jgi:hypothetical protein
MVRPSSYLQLRLRVPLTEEEIKPSHYITVQNGFLDAITWIMEGLVKDFTQGGKDKLVGIRNTQGRAIAQAVSRWLPTATTRVRAKVKSCGICCGQSGTGGSFIRVLQFPLLILIPPTAQHSSSSITRGWYKRSVSGRRTKWTQAHSIPRN